MPVGRVETGGVEAPEVDAVAEQLGGGRDAPAPQEREVLGVLDQFGVGAPGCRGFERVHREPLRPGIGLRRVQPMHRVHDDGDACDAAHDASVQARLRVVHVEDVGALAAQDPPQVDHGSRVVPGADRSR